MAPSWAEGVTLDTRESTWDVTPYCADLDQAPQSTDQDHGQGETLCDVLKVALKTAPELMAGQLKVEAQEARIDQSRRIVNPTINAVLEDIAGDGQKRRMDSAELFLTVNQTLDLGGKRRGRVDQARAEAALTHSDLEVERQDLIHDLKNIFLDLLVSQEEMALAERRRSLAQEFAITSQRRMAAGGGSAVDEVKAQVALAASEGQWDEARIKLARATQSLAARLARPPESLHVRGSLESIDPPPSWEHLQPCLSHTPEMRRAKLKTATWQANLAMESRLRTGDPTLTAGLKHTRASRDTGFIVGLSIPLPVFDRNQDAILEAEKRVAASLQMETIEDLKGRRGLSSAYQEMTGAFARAQRQRDILLPQAEKAWTVSLKAYGAGRLSYLEVLDSQRLLFDARAEYIRTLHTYHASRAKVERLIGRGMGDLGHIDRSPRTRPQ